jgi:hypothetical protein
LLGMTALVDAASTYARLAGLPLVVDSYGLEGLARRWSADFTRRSTVVRLAGGGHVGVGEDVTYTPHDHENVAELPLAGCPGADLFGQDPRRQRQAA